MNAAGTELVRNDFGSRAVNPSTGLGSASGSRSFQVDRRTASPTGAVRQTVADVGGAEYVLNAAGTEWVRNDFGGRAVNPSTGLGGSSGDPSSFRGAVRSASPTGAVRQTVADVGGAEYVPNAAGTEWVRNDFGGRAVSPSTGLGGSSGDPSFFRGAPRSASPTGAVRQTVADVGGAEYVPNAAGTEWVRNDFGGRAVSPSTGLGGSSGDPSFFRGAPRSASPTGAVRQTVADVGGPEYVLNAAGTEWVRNDFGGRAVNPSTGLNLNPKPPQRPF